MPLLIARKSKKEAQEIAKSFLKEAGLEDWIDHKPDELSVGENQRVAVARTLSCSPAIVLGRAYRQPQYEMGDRINELLRRLNREYNQTFIVIIHNEDLA